MDARELFLENLKLIEDVVRFEVSRHRLDESEAEDFKSTVMVKLIDNDYAVIRKFRGQSSLRTFLATVVANAYKDYRNREKGKFRNSNDAKRRGACAKELDTLIHREHRTLEEAILILLAGYPEETRGSLTALAQDLPEHNTRPRPAPLDDAVDVPGPDDAAERVLAGERLEKSRRVSRVIGEAVQALQKVDRQILALHYTFGMTVAEIARSLRIEQKLLYPRMTALKQRLREAMERAGFSAQDLNDLVRREGLELNFGLGSREEGPSTSSGENSRDDSDDADDDDP